MYCPSFYISKLRSSNFFVLSPCNLFLYFKRNFRFTEILSIQSYHIFSLNLCTVSPIIDILCWYGAVVITGEQIYIVIINWRPWFALGFIVGVEQSYGFWQMHSLMYYHYSIMHICFIVLKIPCASRIFWFFLPPIPMQQVIPMQHCF